MIFFIRKHLFFIRKHLYKRGYRPKYPSIFYSPSLDLMYAFEGFTEAFRREVMSCKGENSNVCVAEGCFGMSCTRSTNGPS